MNTKKIDNLKSLLILLLLILITRLIPDLPWWSFVAVVVIAGTVINYLEWQTSFFGIGFLAGFLLWTGATFYFDATQVGNILASVGRLLFLPKTVVIAISGISGGLVAGLAFYTGKSILVEEKRVKREVSPKQ